MAFQSVPDTVEIVILYSGNSVEVANVMNAHKLGGYAIADIISLANVVDDEISLAWLPIQINGWTYLSTTVRGLDTINDLEATNTDSTGPGLVVGNALPGNVTISIKKSSGLTGRSARGRLFWIGLAQANLDPNENLVLTAAVTAAVAAVEAVRARIETAGWSPVIVSRFLDGVKRPTGATFPWIDTVAVNENVDSQRGRLLS